MSGHSKWSTIKRKKQAEDIKKGKVFSKLSRAITVAVRTGGDPDPETNPRLRMEIERAKSANMPKENIKRAIDRANKEGEDLEEVDYEGYGPKGIAVIVEATTDNKNRTAQEIKNFFEKGGGKLAGPGAVSYNFEPRGLLLVEKKGNSEQQMLELIDAGAQDVEEAKEGIEVYTVYEELAKTAEKIKEKGFEISSMEPIKEAKSNKKIEDEGSASKVLKFLRRLEDHDDVQKVFSNVDIPDEIVDKIDA